MRGADFQILLNPLDRRTDERRNLCNLMGELNGELISILLDSGADVSVIKSYLVPAECINGESKILSSVGGKWQSVGYADVRIISQGCERMVRPVVVDCELPIDLILGMDFLTRYKVFIDVLEGANEQKEGIEEPGTLARWHLLTTAR